MLAVPALDRVVVVLGSYAEEVAAAVKFASAEPIVCPDWSSGMAASLRCGGEELAGADWVIVALGDMPGVTPEAIEAVIYTVSDNDNPAHAPYGSPRAPPNSASRPPRSPGTFLS